MLLKRPGKGENYFTATVVCPALAVPTESESGTALPVGEPAGTFTLTCSTPAEISPANCTAPGTPPKVTDTAPSGAGQFAEGGSLPVTPAGEVCPSPVANKVTISPRAAGLVSALKVEFWLTDRKSV